MIGYASDTASVMVGKHNSVLSRLLEKQPKLFSLVCLCHLNALCAAAALKKLPVSLDDLLVLIVRIRFRFPVEVTMKSWPLLNQSLQAAFQTEPLGSTML